jgi:hypothetical protein
MNEENKIIPSFFFSRNEYLYIFGVNSLLTLNNFINTTSSNKISFVTLYRIFAYGMFEYQKQLINSPDVGLNIIRTIIGSNNKKSDIDKIYRMCLSAKNIEDFTEIRKFIL